jgi:hypothetical protein
MNHPVKQTKLDQMVEDIKALGLDKNPVYYHNTGFTDECSLYTLSPTKPLGECAEAIGTIKDFWLPELFSSAPELALEVKRLREGMKMMLDDMNNASPEEDIKYWLDTWKHWLKEMIK